MKKKNQIVSAVPTSRSLQDESVFWAIISLVVLIIYFILAFFSWKKGSPLPVLEHGIWIGMFIMVPVILTIRSYLKIKQIKTFEANYILQYATITGHHEEDSDLGSQPFIKLYLVYFKVNDDFVGKQRVSYETYHQLKSGDLIVVRVSPDNPKLFRAEIE